MKVVFCAYDFVHKVGGPNVWLLRLLPALVSRGVDAKALFFSQDPLMSPTADALARMGVKIVVAQNPRFTEQKIQWIFEQLRNDPPDIFVPNLVLSSYYAGGWIRKSGIPTVGVLHSDDDFYRGVQDEFVFGDEFFRLSSLVCVSKYLYDEVSAKSPDNILLKVIPCGTPTSQKVAARSNASLKIAYVGRLEEEQKRISDVAMALCRAVEEVPGVEATIYGVGSAQSSVEKVLAQHGKGLPVRLAGMVPSDEILSHLLKHHVFVLLSDYEGLPIALMEAMACGLVPVCTDMRSGIPELVQHENNGLIVQNRGDDFVASIRRLKENTRLWNELSHRARKKVEEGYSAEACADRWYQLLTELRTASTTAKHFDSPSEIRLPPIRPGLAREDLRQVTWLLYFFKRIRRAIVRSFRSKNNE